MPFVKGQSGNPNGRPAAHKDIQELARQHTPAAIRALVDALTKPGERVAAANALLDRGYGKPGQTVDLRHHLPAATATDADLLAIASAGGGVIAAQARDQEESGGVVH